MILVPQTRLTCKRHELVRHESGLDEHDRLAGASDIDIQVDAAYRYGSHTGHLMSHPLRRLSHGADPRQGHHVWATFRGGSHEHRSRG